MKTNKKQIKDKVELEKLIDEYLTKEIPLLIFLEEYDLTFPQQKLFFNRIKNYDRRVDAYIENYDGYDINFDEINVPEDQIVISHVIEEKNPVDREIRRERFLTLRSLEQDQKNKEELLAKLAVLDESEISKLNIDDKTREKYSRIKLLLEDLDELVKFGKIKNSDYEQLLKKYSITKKDLIEYQQLYQLYNNVKLDYENKQALEQELKVINRKIEKLKEEIVVTNTKLVNWVIRKFFNGIPLPSEDTQMVALSGLVEAINRYNPNMEYQDENGQMRYVQFSTYAVKVIISTIKKNFKNLMGVDFYYYYRKKILDSYREFSEDSDKMPFSDIEVDNIDSIPNAVINFSSLFASDLDLLEESVDLDGRMFTDEDYDALDKYEDSTSFVDEESDDIGQSIIDESNREILLESLERLSPREEAILIKRFGLDGSTPQTYESIGKEYNLSGSYIGTIIKAALRKIKNQKNPDLAEFRNDREYFLSKRKKKHDYSHENGKLSNFKQDKESKYSIESDELDSSETFMAPDGRYWEGKDDYESSLTGKIMPGEDIVQNDNSQFYIADDGSYWASKDDYESFLTDKIIPDEAIAQKDNSQFYISEDGSCWDSEEAYNNFNKLK